MSKANGLPKYVHTQTIKGRLYCYFGFRGKRFPLPIPSSSQFHERYEFLLSRAGATATSGGEIHTDHGKCYFQEMERSARGRARRYDREYTLPAGWMKATYDAQNGCCAITNIPMHRGKGETRAPWAPSIDRKDPSRGYTPENCHVVAYAVNVAKNQFDKTTVVMVARGLLRHYGQTENEQ